MKLLKDIYLKRDTNKWSIFTLAIVVCIAIPILTIFFKLFSGPGETWSHLVKHVLADYILNSIWLVIGCSILTLFFGVSSAWIVSRYEIPYRKFLEWMLILPLAIPSYITAYAYAGIFDYGGSLEILMKTIGISSFKLDVMNIFGLILILSLSLFPYIYVSARAIFLYQSGRLIEASKLLGATERGTFFKIVLPVARPAIVGGLILVLMEVLNDYGAAKYFGVSTFTTGIFRSWFSLGEPSTAVYLSAILLFVVFILIYLERLQRGAKSYYNSYKSNNILKKKTVTTKRQLLLLCIVSIPIVFGFIIPLSQLIYWSFLTYKDVISSSFFIIALQSLGISFLTAFFTVFTALMILYFPKWNRLKALKKVSRITILGYAIPGAVIAVGVMIPSLTLDKWFIKIVKDLWNIKIGLLINGTILVLLYAYVIRFLAVAYNPIEANQLKIGKSLSESSKLLGKGNIRTFFNIELPLLKSGVIGAFILVFVDVMKELPLTLILKPYHINTLAVKAYEYASDELIMESALPSLCIIATGIVPIIILNRLILNEK
ncbi:iron ABC transporter permease [uncultured Aquimarina sp.]|uniref:ABC transporter permease n=1 Tax=uncultured Aquimarina sp. TaxID=575652 RepID=UPI0026331C43|nr:iron ABC transporter permease [uncultured Aquimarina sp.]